MVIEQTANIEPLIKVISNKEQQSSTKSPLNGRRAEFCSHTSGLAPISQEWKRSQNGAASGSAMDAKATDKSADDESSRDVTKQRPLVATTFILALSYLSLHSQCSLVSAQAGRLLLQQTQQQQQQQQASNNEQNVPYQNFYVTRACEWKSNLFVPKSNDIHFAQSSSSALALDSGSQDQSSVVYAEGPAITSNYQPALAGRTQQDASRTMLSTDSKALILALPISIGHSFNGYEPACSIRLIVPRNMRILAKIASRRLTFAQQQLGDSDRNGNSQAELWLNVSQNQFIETEHKTIETEGNVLAFRFLLERFANKQLPDTRFQVVLTAFQTLSDNSDLSGQSGQHNNNFAATNQEQQFICDHQRLISANLACDGFKNCQDGHDEEATTCLAVRNFAAPNRHNVALGGPDSASGTTNSVSGKSPALEADEQQQERPIWTRLLNFTRDANSLAGFLLGFVLVLFLLCCCACLAFAAWRLRDYLRHAHRRRRTGARASAARQEAAQNSENAARLKRAMLNDSDEPKRAPLQVPARLHSILKKPGNPLSGQLEPGAPLFGPRPAEPPPEAPVSRGALSSSLRDSGRAGLKSDFRPTPARRLTRPSRTPPAPGATPTPTAKDGGTSRTSSNKSSERISTYHFSSGSTSFSPAYLARLAEQTAPASPPSGAQVNYEESNKSPTQSSLI